MILKNYILEWSNTALWQEAQQVEQDLIITRALLELYGSEELRELVAFRGGTALNKLFFKPAVRYSEDIDLVQISAAPIGNILDLIRKELDPWLGTPKREFSNGLVTLTYKFISDDGFPLKLKVEINSREHFSILGLQDMTFTSNSSWAPGEVSIRTFKIEELLGTKMRALYQRRKGRDLFDLYMALTKFEELNHNQIIECFLLYTGKISKPTFLANMENKMLQKNFQEDIKPLLPLNFNAYNHELAFEVVKEKLLEKL